MTTIFRRPDLAAQMTSQLLHPDVLDEATRPCNLVQLLPCLQETMGQQLNQPPI